MPNLFHFYPDLAALYAFIRRAPNFYEIHPCLDLSVLTIDTDYLLIWIQMYLVFVRQ
jgi:hypothetical protein